MSINVKGSFTFHNATPSISIHPLYVEPSQICGTVSTLYSVGWDSIHPIVDVWGQYPPLFSCVGQYPLLRCVGQYPPLIQLCGTVFTPYLDVWGSITIHPLVIVRAIIPPSPLVTCVGQYHFPPLCCVGQYPPPSYMCGALGQYIHGVSILLILSGPVGCWPQEGREVDAAETQS